MEETKLLLELDLSLASREVIEILIEDTSEPSIFAEIAKTNTHRPEILRILIENADTPDEVREEVSKTLSTPVGRRSAEMVKARMRTTAVVTANIRFVMCDDLLSSLNAF